jgi:hypothetical protein
MMGSWNDGLRCARLQRGLPRFPHRGGRTTVRRRCVSVTLALTASATLAACTAGPTESSGLQPPDAPLFSTAYIGQSTSDLTLHVLEINHRFQFFFNFGRPIYQRVPACDGGCDYLYPAPTVTAGASYSLGAAVGPQILNFDVLGCNPDLVNVCFYGWVGGLGGNKYGVDLNYGADDYNDLIFELLYEEPRDTLAVSVTLNPDTARPVLDRTFDAASQFWSDPQTPPRADFTQVSVQASWEPSGRPVAGAVALLTVEPVDSSGGHHHDAGSRPKGTFFPAGASEQERQTKSRVQDHLEVTLDANGQGSAVYRTSGLSGLEVVKASVTQDGSTKVGKDTIQIRWPGLEAMPRSGTTYVFSDQTPATGTRRHGNVNNWVQPALRDSVLKVFDVYIARKLERHSTDGDRFVITDASLQWGGLLDVDATVPWRNPHKLHRTGQDMDVRYWNIPAAGIAKLREACRQIGISCEVHPTNDPDAPDVHYHFARPR